LKGNENVQYVRMPRNSKEKHQEIEEEQGQEKEIAVADF
jgi:hypothetical protein